MSKYLFIAALGAASTNAYWTWPADQEAQAWNDKDNWTWLAEPVESDFPYQSQADWFQQGEWTGNSMQDYVHGWYVTEGVWAISTMHNYDVDDTNKRLTHTYALNANDLSFLVQANMELMRWMFGNVYGKIYVSKAPILKVGLIVPTDLNCYWDNECVGGIGLHVSSMAQFWGYKSEYLGSTKACTGNFFELIDGADFEGLITCKYMYPDKYTLAETPNGAAMYGWKYEPWWTF